MSYRRTSASRQLEASTQWTVPPDLPAVGGIPAPGVGVVFAQYGRDGAGLVLDAAGAPDDVRPLEAHLVAREKAVVFFHRFLHKIL